MAFTPNVNHPLDRAARVVIGLALFSLIYFLDGYVRWIGLLGIPLLLSAKYRYCFAYKICKVGNREPK